MCKFMLGMSEAAFGQECWKNWAIDHSGNNSRLSVTAVCDCSTKFSKERRLALEMIFLTFWYVATCEEK